MAELSDEELFIEYLQGHIQSFEILFERYKSAVYQLALEHTDSSYEASETLQKIFLRVHTLRRHINRKHQFSQWLFVISLSEINRIFEGSPQVLFSENVQSLQLLKPQEVEKDSDFGAYLKETSSALTDEDAELLHMRFVDGLAFEEIAHELGITGHG